MAARFPLYLLVLAIIVVPAASTSKSAPAVTALTIDSDRPVARFRPDQAFGLAFDGGDKGESAPLFKPENRSRILGAGAAWASYRLRTELGVQAWHWTAFGHWSDQHHQEGYWTGDEGKDDPSPVSYGYRLPRRGDTLDEAGNDGFSRLDDGDPKTFWKSNPYLDPYLGGRADDRSEWIKIDLGRAAQIDAIELDWAEPFARRYRVQYWTGEDPYGGAWKDFPAGVIDKGEGGHLRLRLAEAAIAARFVRLLLLKSSHSTKEAFGDLRDSAGYALGEIRLGKMGSDGSLTDAIRHSTDRHTQSLIFVSSTDPWHRAKDIDVSTEQPSPLALLNSGLIPRRAMTMPVGVLYDTPENASAEIAYFRRRGLIIDQVELGEEPDGQRVDPEDYAKLYSLFAARLAEKQQHLTFGGPSLVNGVADMWLDENPNQSWTSRFLRSLNKAGDMSRLGFFSFEYYPFDDLCGSAQARIADAPAKMDKVFKRLERDGLPTTTLRLISELGMSSHSGRAEVEAPSAIFTADTIAGFLSRGGATAFFYGATPDRTAPGEAVCAGRGNLMLWEAQGSKARWPMPSYYGYRLLTRYWSESGNQEHTLFAASPTPVIDQGPNLGVYPLKRPDGSWAVLLVNRSAKSARVSLTFKGASSPPKGRTELYRYGSEQFTWSVAADHPVRDRPPRRSILASWPSTFSLPGLSLTVVRQASNDRS
jgi:hypothetical protein